MAYLPILDIPEDLTQSIQQLLQLNPNQLAKNAQVLTQHYRSQSVIKIDSPDLARAYCALRLPATFAQISYTLLQLSELLPDFQPKSVLDIGAGPGTALWAINSIWPNIQSYTALDFNPHFEIIFQQLTQNEFPKLDLDFTRINIIKSPVLMPNPDLVIVSNFFNELPANEIHPILNRVFALNPKVVIIIEPGTPIGEQLIHKIAQHHDSTPKILAPFIDQTIAVKPDGWIHFYQRFQRPEFQRRLRQTLRDSKLMASDIEIANLSFLIFSNLTPSVKPIARIIDTPNIFKPFLEIELLTASGYLKKRILKSQKQDFSIAKKLKAGEIITSNSNLNLTA